MTVNRWTFQHSTNNNHFEVNAFMHEFKNEDDRTEMLEKLKIGSQFDMRYRSVFFYYGNDFIAYKRKHPSSNKVNEFLRVICAYMANYLENDCPPSWKDCDTSYWEELIYVIYPNYITLKKKQNDSKTFLTQLKRFVYWLDKEHQTSLYPTLETLTNKALPALIECENLTNRLFLHAFPDKHHKYWDPARALFKLQEGEENDQTYTGFFEVMDFDNNVLTVNDLVTGLSYSITNFPIINISRNVLLNGIISKNNNDFFWSWHCPIGVYPSEASQFIRLRSDFLYKLLALV
ncbi:hypothetical protein ACLIA0_07220 [Bacillaceae bacterium W0354]